jgi:hypothetical protein
MERWKTAEMPPVVNPVRGEAHVIEATPQEEGTS